jgi:hypothetical protein
MQTENFAGIMVYSDLPENMKVATRQDLMDGDRPRLGLWFIVHGFVYCDYEAYQIRQSFRIEDWLPWLDAGRIYVKENIQTI